jgi:ComF family protein
MVGFDGICYSCSMNELVSASQDAAPTRFAQIRDGVRAALCAGLDVVLPRLCPSCRARLGIPFIYDPGPGLLLMEAIANPPAYDRARAGVRYDDIARALVLSFKYGDRLDLAPMIGQWMARAGRELLADANALIPVPLHWRRLWSRRFHQSATLAGAISGLSGVPVLHDALKRVRATPQQVGLSKNERADNVQGAFRVLVEKKSDVAGRRLMLIDDVLTSGATVDTCARVLLRAGAAHVDVLVFARVVAPVRTTI